MIGDNGVPMKNNIYQKLHRVAMKIMHFIHAPLEAHDLRNPSKGVAVPLDNLDVERKPITNQGKYSYLKYGASDIGKTGCIPIAIYNVLILKNRKSHAEQDDAGDFEKVGESDMPNIRQEVPSFDEIVVSVKRIKAPLMGGRMGTDPYMIDKILENFGVRSIEITDKESLEKAMCSAERGALFLITQWNDARRPLKGIHAYVVE